MTALDKPRAFSRKDALDIVTETDTAAEKAIVKAIQDAFPQHAILGEEGGVLGNVNSDYLWSVQLG